MADWAPAVRGCSQCGEVYGHEEFSRNQWSKGVGLSRCMSCVAGEESAHSPARPHTARRNISSEASFRTCDLDYPFAEGTFRWVAKGVYTSGNRRGQKCVSKWFKSGCVYEATYFEKDIKACDRALHILEQWNLLDITQHIQLNLPEVWTDGTGQKSLQEPFIENWQKFNSNTGWARDGTRWEEAMQALSHYSYHISSGQFVLCDLQGGVYNHGVILSDPVILSRSQSYGVTDLGKPGILNFFAHHRCNRYCRSHWTRPRDPVQYFRAFKGTTMQSWHGENDYDESDNGNDYEESDSDSDYY